MTDNPDRRAAGPAAVVETDDPTVPTEVVIVERTGSDGNTFQQLPFALAPGPPVPTTALRESIESTAAAVASGSPQLPSTALMDVLLRRPPRTRSGAALPRSSDPVTDMPRRRWTWTRHTWRCTALRGPARRTPRPG